MSSIYIPVPKLGDDLVEYFNRFIKDDVGDLAGQLVIALDLDMQDDRAQVDNVEIVDVKVQGRQVLIDYEVDYSAHFGCRDMNYAERDQRTLLGKVKKGQFVFDEFVSPEPRSTLDEF